ncbi:hypothetical protein GCM10009740_31930 [Terrabacter terrae]|uniref:Uncharacterized protein n=1 Tax=Terrabacter terrae TaxID=318434 RepID=A0ABP5G062_9MICO
MLKLPPSIPPSAPWSRTKVIALLSGILAGLAAAAVVIVAAGFAEGRWESYIVGTSGVAGLWSGYYTYKAITSRTHAPDK